MRAVVDAAPVLSSDPAVPQRTLDDIEQDFKRTMIPEMEILDTPKGILTATIGRLVVLRNEALAFDMRTLPLMSGSGTAYDARIRLLEMIGREILLYEQFVDMDAGRLQLTLEEIMREPIEDMDEAASVVLGSDTSNSSPPSIFEGVRRVSKQYSIDSLRSSFSAAPVQDQRRASIATLNFLGPRSHVSNNVSSLQSTDSFARLQESAVMSVPPGPYDFVKWTKLRKLSVSLFNDAFHRQIGTPTVFSVAGVIAIGTSKSVVLLYDLAQNLLGILGDASPISASMYGAVTAVHISLDQKHVLAGYARGFVMVWDVQRRASIKVVPPVTDMEQIGGKKDGHLSGAPVIHLASLSATSFVSADDRGSAFYHSVSRGIVLTSVKSTRIHGRPLANPSQQSLPTTIFSVAALAPISGRHQTDQYRLVAIATPYKMAIMSMKPVPQIQYRVPWDLSVESGPETTPRKPAEAACLDWWSPVLQKNGSVAGEPRLAYSHRNQVSFLSVTCSISETDKSKRHIHFTPDGHCHLQDNIVALRWINESLVACVTRAEQLITVSTSSGMQLESVGIGAYSPISQPYFHKPLQLFNMPIDLAYMGSFCVYRHRMMILGKDEVLIASLLPWSDRVASLIRVGNFREAFGMAVSFYRGEERYAAIGIPRNPDLARGRIADHVSSLILGYVSMSLSGYYPNANEDLAAYRQVTETIMETCIAIGRLDLLFGEVYDRFLDAGLSLVFLELLEPFVLSERIRSISNPAVVQALMTHFLSRSWVDRLEQMLLHMDPTTLDVHQIVHLCREHGLYNALIFVYNAVVQDFVTPMVDLLKLCSPAGPRPSLSVSSAGPVSDSTAVARVSSVGGDGDSDRAARNQSAVYILYVYLAYTLTGIAFPMGTLQPEQASKAKVDIYSFLLSPCYARYQRMGPIVIGTEPFPYLRLLVETDARELVKALGIIFEDASLSDGIKINDRIINLSPSESSPPRNNSVAHAVAAFRKASQRGVTRQLIVDTLLQAVALIESGVDASNALQVEALASMSTIVFAFVARSFAKYRMHVRLADDVVERLLTVLGSSAEVSTKTEREISILALFDSVGGISGIRHSIDRPSSGTSTPPAEPVSLVPSSQSYASSDPTLILEKYERAGLWRVYEYVARGMGRLGLVLRAFLNDELRSQDAFQAMRELLDSGTLTYQQSLDVKQSILDYLVALVELDGPAAARLVDNYWPTEHAHILDTLDATPRLAFAYLRGLVAPQTQKHVHPSIQLSSATIIMNALPGPSAALSAPDESSERPKHTGNSLLYQVGSSSRQPQSSPSLPLPVYPPGFYNTYIRLMCQLDAAQVYPYLIWLSDTFEALPFDIETVIQTVRSSHVTDATAWMLERTGDFTGALSAILGELSGMAEQLVAHRNQGAPPVVQDQTTNPAPAALSTDSAAASAATARIAIASLLELAIALCERASLVLEDPDQRALWFSLLSEIYFKLPQSCLPPASVPSVDGVALSRSPPLSLIAQPSEPATAPEPTHASTHSGPSSSLSVSLAGSASASAPQSTLSSPGLTPRQGGVSEPVHETSQQAVAAGAQPLDAHDDVQAFCMGLARRVMNAVVGHVSLPEIIFHIVQTQQGARLADHRDMIFSMLDSHDYHREMFQAATRIIAADTYRLLEAAFAAHTRGLRPIRGQCEACRRLLHVRAMFDEERDEQLVLFDCRHTFHKTCLETSLEAAADRMGLDGYQDYGLWCPVCGRRKHELRKHLKGKGKQILKSMPDLAKGFTDTPRVFDSKVDQLDEVLGHRRPLISLYHWLDGQTGQPLGTDDGSGFIVDMNENRLNATQDPLGYA
ncbi:Golgi CORVET complex core vacuolar protein 8-domain-containing protein [Entophlyctis helioformis]|nr:Golgi CORVET complex core vacuolar protein 8-domain-containing protein [Entophlyctis helioformis]